MNKHFRSVFILCMLGFAMLLAGCSRELQQQHAFISFLQKEVIPRNSGFLIPPDMHKKFGDYAAHYNVIVDYNKTILSKVTKPLEKLQREYQDAMKPETSVEGRKDAIIKYRDALQLIGTSLDTEYAAVESKLAALNQPPNVKEVYGQAVEKHIRIPAKSLKDLIVAIKAMLNKNLDWLDYIILNKGTVEIKDGMIQVDRNKKDYQVTLTRLEEMQKEIRDMDDAIQAQHTEITRQSIGK